MPSWSKPTRFRVTTAFENPGVQFKDEGEVLEFVIDNRGPGTVFFSADRDVTQFTGQRLPVGAIWIEDTCPHSGKLYFTADSVNTDIVVKVKTP